MSILNSSIKRVVAKDYLDEDSDILENVSGGIIDSECRLDGEGGDGGVITSSNMEAEKRIRREIANSNERRRMQSINAGFQSLRTLLPHHEGEKLSKAAILQQTAEYIYNLEQEKTRLLSQNCQLMRQVQQHEGGDVPVKKRKTEVLVVQQQPQQILGQGESSDEGIGSVSPEPQAVGLVAVLPAPASTELTELQCALERERSLRAHLEEQLRALEQQLYGGALHYHQEVEVKNEVEEVVEVDMQLVAADSLPPVAHTQTVVSLSRSPSPAPPEQQQQQQSPPRLPSALEAAIKAEPKVEVERLPSPPPHDDMSCSSRIYVNTSRQNLETIVEAIRHLEGDHLFGDEPQQDVPLALTNKSIVTAATTTTTTAATTAAVAADLNPYLHFHATSVSVQQQQQSRPGVIVVKQHS